MPKAPKRRNRRNSKKYPALDPKLNLKTRFEILDYDYLDKLGPKELKWLNDFTNEWAIADFKSNKKRIHPKKFKEKLVKKTGEIKQVDIAKQESEHRNNARNRDIYTKAKATGTIAYIEELEEGSHAISSEDELIEEIDKKRKLLEEVLNLKNSDNSSNDKGDESDEF